MSAIMLNAAQYITCYVMCDEIGRALYWKTTNKHAESP